VVAPHLIHRPHLFAKNEQLTKALDAHCDMRLMHETRKPLVITGAAGSGKSAALANWVHARKEKAATISEEFVFCHFAGCSEASTHVRNLLWRICTALKTRFSLKCKLTYDEQALSWEFPRCLQLAALKGHAIIVIDGLEALTLLETENNLRWLPMAFPAKIRLVLAITATVPELVQYGRSRGGDKSGVFLTQVGGAGLAGKSNKDQILVSAMELGLIACCEKEEQARQRLTLLGELFKRRSLVCVQCNPMSIEARVAVLQSFCSRRRCLYLAQIQRVAELPQSRNTLFLITAAGFLRFAMRANFDVWSIIDGIAKASTCSELYDFVIRQVAGGCVPDPDGAAKACEQAGGHTAFIRAKEKLPSADNDVATGFLEGEDIVCDGGMLGGKRGSSHSLEFTSLGLGDPVKLRVQQKARYEAHRKKAAEKIQASARGYVSRRSSSKSVVANMTSSERLPSVINVTPLASENKHVSMRWKVGQKVECKAPGWSNFYPGTITFVNANSTYDLSFPDGDKKIGIQGNRIQASLSSSTLFPTHVSAPTSSKSQKNERDEDDFEDDDGLEEEEEEEEKAKEGKYEDGDEEEEDEAVSATAEKNVPPHGLPSYITGGMPSRGLGAAVVNALRLLYVSYAGLTSSELWKLLTLMETPIEKDVERSALVAFLLAVGIMHLPPVHQAEDPRKATTNNIKTNNSSVRPPSQAHTIPHHGKAVRGHLKPLISLLPQLKVLADTLMPKPPPEMSGSKNELSRDQVAEILQMRLSEHIIKLFNKLPPCPRRAEELPHALQRCKSWVALAQCVADVPMFLLLFHGAPTLRANLVFYWRQLASGVSSKDDFMIGAKSLQHNDPVDTYDSSVSNWVAVARPTALVMFHVLGDILSFMRIFSKYESHVPKFAHPGLSKVSLKALELAPVQANFKDNKQYYFYQRWIWVQFPWMALAMANKDPTVVHRLRYDLATLNGRERHDSGVWRKVSGNKITSAIADAGDCSESGPKANTSDNRTYILRSSVTLPAARGAGGLVRGGMARIASTVEKGFWAIKKIQPGRTESQESTYFRGRNQLRAELNKTKQMTAVLKPLVTQHTAKVGRSRAERTVNYGDIPFSKPSRRTTRMGTRFPSVEAQCKEKGDQVFHIFSGGMLDPKRAKTLVTSFPVTTAHLRNLPPHMQDYPATEAEAKLAETLSYVLNLRNQLDRFRFEALRKRDMIEKLTQEVAERKKQDTFTENCIKDGEAMMVQLETRLQRMKMALTVAQQTGVFYDKVVKVCQSSPYKEPRQLQHMERKANAAKQLMDDRIKAATAAEYERRHLLTVEKPMLTKELKINEKMHKKVISKLKKMRARMKQDDHIYQLRSKRRQEIVLEVAGDLTLKEELALKQQNQKHMVFSAQLEANNQSVKDHLQVCMWWLMLKM